MVSKGAIPGMFVRVSTPLCGFAMRQRRLIIAAAGCDDA